MGEIKPLTSLRGIAALMVVAQHFSATAQQHAAGTIPSLIPHGYMAVDLFFILSGFIMAYNYRDAFKASGLRAMPAFLIKRVARIVPLNTSAVLAIVLLGLVFNTGMFYHSTNLPYDTLCNVFLLQGIGIGTNLNGPSWSISTEFAAYLFFPLLLGLTFTRFRIVTGAVVLICLVGLLSLALARPRLGLGATGGSAALIRCFSEFTIGLVTCRVVRSGQFNAWLSRDWLAVAAAGWALGALALRVDLLAVAAFPLVIAALASNDGAVARGLSTPVLYFLGEISFSIYLLHDPIRPVWLALGRAIHPAPFSMPLALAFAAVGVVTVIPVAWVGYRLVEYPGRRWVRSTVSLLPFARTHASATSQT